MICVTDREQGDVGIKQTAPMADIENISSDCSIYPLYHVNPTAGAQRTNTSTALPKKTTIHLYIGYNPGLILLKTDLLKDSL